MLNAVRCSVSAEVSSGSSARKDALEQSLARHAYSTESVRRLLSGEIARLPSFEAQFGLFAFMPWNNMQLERMGDGFAPDLALTGEAAQAAFAALESRNMAALLAHRAA